MEEVACRKVLEGHLDVRNGDHTYNLRKALGLRPIVEQLVMRLNFDGEQRRSQPQIKTFVSIEA